MTDKLKTAACEAIDKAAKELHQLSDQIWNKPELNFEEHHAHEVLTKFLTHHGFPVESKFTLDTAFRATYGSDTGTNVAILCEYDALPEIGHACGHNLIAEVGVAAGLGVKAALDQSGGNLGKLTVLGTPAEEGGGGKQLLIDAGVFKDIDLAMMAHPYPSNRFGYENGIMAIAPMKVTYKGKASHAAAFPWEGINALDAAVMAYNNISCLRQQIKPNWRIHGVITNGGAKPNIIPELTSMEFYVRAPTKAELAVFKEKVVSCLEAAAKATGCQVEIEGCMSYDDMVMNNTFLDIYAQNATQLGLEQMAAHAGLKGSTDMGNVSHVVPSIHPFFYVGSDAVNHTRPMTEAVGDPKAQPYTILQAKVLACTAIDVMRKPGVVAKMKEELSAAIGAP